MSDSDSAALPPLPPQRLRRLTQWQASKLSTLGTRLTAQHMPLVARSDFAMLAALDEYGPLSQAELGRRLGLDRNDVNGILNRLEASGHVAREADSTDRRRNVVTGSTSGLAYLEQLQQHANAVQDDLLHGLAASEREQLGVLLAKVLASHAPQPA